MCGNKHLQETRSSIRPFEFETLYRTSTLVTIVVVVNNSQCFCKYNL